MLKMTNILSVTIQFFEYPSFISWQYISLVFFIYITKIPFYPNHTIFNSYLIVTNSSEPVG